ncbi:Putative ribonuclease III domain-containing protein [Septoria linicola]|uniref:Ribonuclease III domain-containing protein n=1 Tax=Septoria linicola TaxID=215465 RepID=A0A9Q9B372_9PEZI|nr:Putative ribonuclease III domain-containing protein [Septoria linicola]
MAPLAEQARERIEELFTYKTKNLDLLREALYAGGPTTIGGRSLREANKNIALIGDSVLKTVLVTDSWEAGMMKGPSTDRTSFVLSNANLDVVGRAQGLERFLVLNDIYQKVSPYMVATAVEAIFGAIYYDSGMDAKVVRRGMLAFGLL